MRTTLTIDDDVLDAARDRARRERTTVGDVLSRLARAGLTAPSSGDPQQDRHGFTPLASRGTPVTNALIDALREEEAE